MVRQVGNVITWLRHRWLEARDPAIGEDAKWCARCGTLRWRERWTDEYGAERVSIVWKHPRHGVAKAAVTAARSPWPCEVVVEEE